jgi:hypothetical protein
MATSAGSHPYRGRVQVVSRDSLVGRRRVLDPIEEHGDAERLAHAIGQVAQHEPSAGVRCREHDRDDDPDARAVDAPDPAHVDHAPAGAARDVAANLILECVSRRRPLQRAAEAVHDDAARIAARLHLELRLLHAPSRQRGRV